MVLRLTQANSRRTVLVVNMANVNLMYTVMHDGLNNCTKLVFDDEIWCIVVESVDEIMKMLNK